VTWFAQIGGFSALVAEKFGLSTSSDFRMRLPCIAAKQIGHFPDLRTPVSRTRRQA
jgi:hypothetical protein